MSALFKHYKIINLILIALTIILFFLPFFEFVTGYEFITDYKSAPYESYILAKSAIKEYSDLLDSIPNKLYAQILATPIIYTLIFMLEIILLIISCFVKKWQMCSMLAFLPITIILFYTFYLFSYYGEYVKSPHIGFFLLLIIWIWQVFTTSIIIRQLHRPKDA